MGLFDPPSFDALKTGWDQPARLVENDIATLRELLSGNHPWQQGLVRRFSQNYEPAKPTMGMLETGRHASPGQMPWADLSGIGSWGLNYDEAAPAGDGEMPGQVAALPSAPGMQRAGMPMPMPGMGGGMPSPARPDQMANYGPPESPVADDLQTYTFSPEYSDQQRIRAYGSPEVANIMGMLVKNQPVTQQDYDRTFGVAPTSPEVKARLSVPQGTVAPSGAVVERLTQAPRDRGINEDRLRIAEEGLAKARAGRKGFTQDQKDRVRDVVLANRARRREEMARRKELRNQRIPRHIQYAMMAQQGRGAAPLDRNQIALLSLMQKAQDSSAGQELDRMKFLQDQQSMDMENRFRLAQLAMGQQEHRDRMSRDEAEREMYQQRNLLDANPELYSEAFMPPEIKAELEQKKREQILQRAQAALRGDSDESPSEAIAILRNEGLSDAQIEAMLPPGATLQDPGGWSFGNFFPIPRSPQGTNAIMNPRGFFNEFLGK